MARGLLALVGRVLHRPLCLRVAGNDPLVPGRGDPEAMLAERPRLDHALRLSIHRKDPAAPLSHGSVLRSGPKRPIEPLLTGG